MKEEKIKGGTHKILSYFTDEKTEAQAHPTRKYRSGISNPREIQSLKEEKESPKMIEFSKVQNRFWWESDTPEIVPAKCNLWHGTEQGRGERRPSASQEEGHHPDTNPDLGLHRPPSLQNCRK